MVFQRPLFRHIGFEVRRLAALHALATGEAAPAGILERAGANAVRIGERILHVGVEVVGTQHLVVGLKIEPFAVALAGVRLPRRAGNLVAVAALVLEEA